MALFSQYAVAAAEEALEDSGWRPRSDEEQERAVRSTLSTPTTCETGELTRGDRVYV